MERFYVGLMSGTSLDGIDIVVVSFENSKVHVVGSQFFSIPSLLKAETLKLCHAEHTDEVQILGQVDIKLGELFAQSVVSTLEQLGISKEQIVAIGSHGQTVRHHPDIETPFTLQIGNPAVIAQRTGLTTVANFRQADIARGGQGAPLVPAFHQAAFRSTTTDRVVVNIGGMANITYLPKDKNVPVLGFDTGPGNVLMNAWVEKSLGKHYDEDGAWAATGEINRQLVSDLLRDPYFRRSPPKSTGREMFNLAWLEKILKSKNLTLSPQDLQASLAQFTAASIALAIELFAPKTQEVYVCGGGAFNKHLMQLLEGALPTQTVATTSQLGIDPDYVEAITFAWLAKQTLQGKPGNIASVTGADQPTVLGGIYPGKNFPDCMNA